MRVRGNATSRPGRTVTATAFDAIVSKRTLYDEGIVWRTRNRKRPVRFTVPRLIVAAPE
jgi:hypothetical protein